MSFESVRQFKPVRVTQKPDALLSATIANCRPITQEASEDTPIKEVRFSIGKSLMERLDLHNRDRVDFLIDSDSNQGMLRIATDGLKVSVPQKKDGSIGDRGYVCFRLPKRFNDALNIQGWTLHVLDVFSEGVVFGLPEPLFDYQRDRPTPHPLSEMMNRYQDLF
jgi:hypothetical protein